tara:strand:- start:21 stop:497 length:477 start_codon:yes stop_codon:yes gene_type:complete
MGVGKTTIGRILAKQLDFDFIDTDQRLEKITGASISWIFDIEGEAGFRRREQQLIQELTGVTDAVIATGGGVILLSENRFNLKSNSIVIYLKGEVETLYERTRLDNNRPLLETANPRETIERILSEREHLYVETADFEIEIDGRSAEYIVTEISGLLS